MLDNLIIQINNLRVNIYSGQSLEDSEKELIKIKKLINKMKKKLIEIPTDLFQQIEKSADKNERSVNKEITFLLKSALAKK